MALSGSPLGLKRSEKSKNNYKGRDTIGTHGRYN
jgi:hypothetical protein